MKVVITEKLWDLASCDKDKFRYERPLEYYVEVASLVMHKEILVLSIYDYSCGGKYLIDEPGYLNISDRLFKELVPKYELVPSKNMLSFPSETITSDFYGVTLDSSQLRETGLKSRPQYLFGKDLVISLYLGIYGDLRISHILYSPESLDDVLNFVKEFDSVLQENSVNSDRANVINVKFLMFRAGNPAIYDRTIDLKDDVSQPALFAEDLPEKGIIDFLKSSESGIVILHGIPGSGKSSYIKHLIHDNSDSIMFYVVDGNSVDKLDHLKKGLIESTLATNRFKFMNKEEENKQKVFILEDCEKILESRTGSSGNSAMSDLLNLSDGIIGDLVGCKFILTFNSGENIDPAVLRKGRTKFMYEFKAATGPRLEELAKIAGIQLTQEDREKGLTLAEIFNYGETNYIKEKTKLGF